MLDYYLEALGHSVIMVNVSPTASLLLKQYIFFHRALFGYDGQTNVLKLVGKGGGYPSVTIVILINGKEKYCLIQCLNYVNNI